MKYPVEMLTKMLIKNELVILFKFCKGFVLAIFFCEHFKKYRNFMQSLGAEILRSGFAQILGWFNWKSVETACRRKISTTENQKKFRYFTQ